MSHDVWIEPPVEPPTINEDADEFDFEEAYYAWEATFWEE
jgi:hypothetical protein